MHKLNEEVLIKAKEYVRESVKKKLSIARPIEERFYAALYLSFRMLKTPKMLDDISRISGVSKTKLGKLYRLLTRGLNLVVPPLDPALIIKSRSDSLKLSRRTIERAVYFVREARKKRITLGKAPASIAAAAVFVACEKEGEKMKQTRIAKAFGVSEPTIRNCFRN